MKRFLPGTPTPRDGQRSLFWETRPGGKKNESAVEQEVEVCSRGCLDPSVSIPESRAFKETGFRLLKVK